ncbi:P-loop containing nucleoside triphosphate hydrolase protein [Amylostereum chailletii]|nr:P-loop containing nucleoside triphosphate hydrolase protein [Amylostereum chailletii]
MSKSHRINLDVKKQSRLQQAYNLPDSQIEHSAEGLLSTQLDPLREFLASLPPWDSVGALRACILLFIVTDGEMDPRQMQLEAVIPLAAGHNSLVDVGTGSRKTLCMVLAVLLDLGGVSLVISPLKWLQINQVREFQRYAIRVMNTGHYSVIIVAPESLDSTCGNNPRIGQLIRDNKEPFKRKIQQVLVDEGHFVHTAGTDLYGLKAYRPAYGHLGSLRVWLATGMPIQVLSGTLPPHIKHSVVNSLGLRPNFTSIGMSSNSPNLIYATHPIIGSLNDFHNLDFLIPPPKLNDVVFFDNISKASDAVTYLESHTNLPENDWNKGIFREYHGDMTPGFLDEVFKSFTSTHGTVKVLCATSGVATGIDSANIAWAVQYGTFVDVSSGRQRGGRAGRNPDVPGLFMTLYEPWAAETDVSSMANIPSDPDAPLQRIDSHSKRRECIASATSHIGLGSFHGFDAWLASCEVLLSCPIKEVLVKLGNFPRARRDCPKVPLGLP